MSSVLDSRQTDQTMTSSHAGGPHPSRARRARADAERKAAAQLERDRDTIRVIDPETRQDRTPQPLQKPVASKGIVKRGADRRQSGQEGSSVSQSRNEGGSSADASLSKTVDSNSSDQTSTSTPDEDSTLNYMDDQSSDSHSTYERSSTNASTAVGKSQMTEAPAASGEQYNRLTGKAERDKLELEKPREFNNDERRQWLQRDVTITLSETPTIQLFSRHDEVVSREDKERSASVASRNERYDKFCASRSDGESGGRYAERGMTTLNNPRKSVHAEIHLPQMKDSGKLEAKTWRLHDEFAKLNEEEVEVDDGGVLKDLDAELAADNDVGEGNDGDDDEGGDGDDDNKPASTSTKKTAQWMTSPSLLETVLVVERAVVANVFEELQLNYRGLIMDQLTDALPKEAASVSPNTQAANRRRQDYAATFASTSQTEKDHVKEEKEREQREKAEAQSAQTSSHKAKLKILWRYGNDITAGKNVSCMAWNRKNQDILAAGYGEYGIPSAGREPYSGMIACWSLKNPLAPERIIQLESDAGVSSMHFSNTHPSLLAVGNTDGTLALYDVRKHGNSPALKSTVSTGQHTGTIWEVRWVERGKDRGESLISISADGHVMEWSIKKGLERSADLMKLKRVPNRNNDASGAMYNKGGTQAREALLSRQSGGMCFDINPREQITYVVGTEDGTIHKCSKSQNENYVLDYAPHAEPVYRIRWNPFCPDYFLTCSADWTSRLYHIDKPEPEVRLDSNRQDAVHDVSWSPQNATIFGAATAHGRVDIWDVADPMQPKTTLELKDRSLNCLLFGEQESPVLTVGDNRGEVTVVKLTGSEFERNGMTDKEQEDRLLERLNA